MTSRHAEPGEGVDAQDLVFELMATDLLVVRIGVSELDVAALEVGQPAEVALDALGGRGLEGQVRRIFPQADAATRLVPLEIALPDGAADAGVQPGFLARVRMQIDTRADVVAAPATAVAEDGDVTFVKVIEDDHLRGRAVETGVRRGDWLEITAGLEPGEAILASDPAGMRDAQPVRIVT